MPSPAESLVDFATRLEPAEITAAALAIDAARTEEHEARIVDHHGWVVAGLLTTPMQYQAGLLARETGVFAFDRLERALLPPADGWLRHDLSLEQFAIRRAGDRVITPKMWPFRQDAPVADFQLSSAPKWWSHGLVHTLLGGGWWPDLDEWQLLHMARLSEVLASWHWYWLAELGRDYCPRHTVASGDGTPDCAACTAKELDASLARVRAERIAGEGGQQIAANSIAVLHYEAYCYEQGLASGELVIPEGNYLTLGESADYARVHLRRLTSAATRRWVEHCLVPEFDYATSPAGFAARAARVAQALLTPFAPSQDVSARRARRVLQDVGDRLCHAAALAGVPTRGYQRGLTALADGIARVADAAPGDVDAVLGDALAAAAADLLQGDPDLARDALQVGYRPTADPAHEPDAMRAARRHGYLARLDASGSPLRWFLPHVPPVVDAVLSHNRSASLVADALAASEVAAAQDDSLYPAAGTLGWFSYAATQWGPDDAARFAESKWYYRLAARSLPPADEWSAWRVRPNPELEAITSSFDLRWLDDLLGGRLAPARVRRPRPVTRVAFVLVGQGRDRPLMLPFTERRKRLLDRLQDTPTLQELVEAHGVPPEQLAEAIDEELVVCLHASHATRLYALNIMKLMAASGGGGTDGGAPLAADPGGPWQDERQAAYYDGYCKRSTLYDDLAAELVRAARVGPGQRVADLGSGTGVSARVALAAMGPDDALIGVDPALRMVVAGRLAVTDPRARFEQGTARLLPHLETPFDRVLCNSALWLDPQLVDALAAIRRALAPGGRFAFSIPAEFLGDNEHWTTPGPGLETAAAIEAARRDLGVSSDAPGTDQVVAGSGQPHPGLLGSVDATRRTLESAGFSGIEVALYRRPWTVVEYLDWMSQPVVLDGAVGAGREAEQARFVAAVRARVDPDAPFESRWFIVTADAPVAAS